MTKSKAPTPQEVYRLRKQQEEQEKLAYLPPGLVNHGNTCFMNSVLQGLIATRLLSNLILFEPIPTEIQHHSVNALLSQRSPQLTNGHALGGIYTRPWVEGMPIGDVFVNTMYKALSVQRNRGRENLSPRQLLMTLGRKYDQYLDFAQQDAHEFLRILLDAMRMEEFDVIKKRQPPQSRRSIRRRTTVMPQKPQRLSPVPTPRSHAPPQNQPLEEVPLMSFVDMLFGGRLTSVLVCQKCKNISHTFEDFNDLSLSIKAEDYAKERKIDRLKKLAKKMGLGRSGTLKPSVISGPETTTQETRVVSEPILQTPVPKQGALTVDVAAVHNAAGAAGGLRPSSVPPTPSPHVEYQEPPFVTESGRRRSLVNLSPRTPDISAASDTEDGDVVFVHHEVSTPLTPEDRKIEFAKEPEREDKRKAGGKGWSEKLGRRLSLGLGRSASVKDKEKRRSRSRGDKERHPPLSKTPTLESSAESIGPEIRLSPPASPPHIRQQASEDQNGDLDATIKPHDRGKQQTGSDVTEDGKLKDQISPPLQNNVSPSAASSSVSLPKFPNIQRSKSPKPPKPSKGETEYLRQILADVTTSTYNFPNLPGFHTNSNGVQSNSSLPSSPHANASWFLKLGLPLPSVEECLKMFTAVEVLDGENMVGCRRCWKIANGCYQPKTGKGVHDNERDDGDESDDEEQERQEPFSGSVAGTEAQRRPSVSSSTTSHTPATPSSVSSPSVNTYGYTSTSKSTSFSSLSSLNSSVPGTASTSDTDLVNLSHRASKPLPPPPLTSLRSHSHGPLSSVNPHPPPTSNHLPLISTSDGSVEVPLHSPLTARPNCVPMRSCSYNAINNDHYNHQSSAPYTQPHSTDSQESLLSIPSQRSRKISSSSRSSISTTEDETSEDEDLESDASASQTVSMTSTTSTSASANSPLHHSSAISASSTSNHTTGAQQPPSKKTKTPKPTIMRPAYKRYLIAIPPPILVIHLKRFQQISKMAMMSFSSGFKKLDDYVAFPEYLDLSPFLAPKKEDFGLGKKGSGLGSGAKGRVGEGKEKRKEKEKEKERCVYRLYAVVVHIGNMLGGHYIAYTALPQQEVASEKTHSQSSHSEEHSKANQPPRQWAYISDTNVRLTTLEEVLKAKAYICLYERM
ncbi:peptidase C19, ubiquitin carboxyl-terminal hydrolase 2 [Marasmius fiardii PR-910]|nr:peptidase C19, ubiquitin carboxyl-terminal hydrolase 2 [Marasmius fiardii PR-910]